MERDSSIEWYELPQRRVSDDSDDISAHGQEDECHVEGDPGGSASGDRDTRAHHSTQITMLHLVTVI